jgi:hypothetical protein
LELDYAARAKILEFGLERLSAEDKAGQLASRQLSKKQIEYACIVYVELPLLTSPGSTSIETQAVVRRRVGGRGQNSMSDEQWNSISFVSEDKKVVYLDFDIWYWYMSGQAGPAQNQYRLCQFYSEVLDSALESFRIRIARMQSAGTGVESILTAAARERDEEEEKEGNNSSIKQRRQSLLSNASSRLHLNSAAPNAPLTKDLNMVSCVIAVADSAGFSQSSSSGVVPSKEDVVAITRKRVQASWETERYKHMNQLDDELGYPFMWYFYRAIARNLDVSVLLAAVAHLLLTFPHNDICLLTARDVFFAIEFGDILWPDDIAVVVGDGGGPMEIGVVGEVAQRQRRQSGDADRIRSKQFIKFLSSFLEPTNRVQNEPRRNPDRVFLDMEPTREECQVMASTLMGLAWIAETKTAGLCWGLMFQETMIARPTPLPTKLRQFGVLQGFEYMLTFIKEEIIPYGLQVVFKFCNIYSTAPTHLAGMFPDCKEEILALPLACRLPSLEARLKCLDDEHALHASLLRLLLSRLTEKTTGNKGGNRKDSPEARDAIEDLKHTIREISALRLLAYSDNPVNLKFFSDIALTFLRKVPDHTMRALNKQGVCEDDESMRKTLRETAQAMPSLMAMMLTNICFLLYVFYDNFAVILRNKGTPEAGKAPTSKSVITVTNGVIVTPVNKTDAVTLAEVLKTGPLLPTNRDQQLDFFTASNVFSWVQQVLRRELPVTRTDTADVGSFHPESGSGVVSKMYIDLEVVANLLTGPRETAPGNELTLFATSSVPLFDSMEDLLGAFYLE